MPANRVPKNLLPGMGDQLSFLTGGSVTSHNPQKNTFEEGSNSQNTAGIFARSSPRLARAAHYAIQTFRRVPRVHSEVQEGHSAGADADTVLAKLRRKGNVPGFYDPAPGVPFAKMRPDQKRIVLKQEIGRASIRRAEVDASDATFCTPPKVPRAVEHERPKREEARKDTRARIRRERQSKHHTWVRRNLPGIMGLLLIMMFAGEMTASIASIMPGTPTIATGDPIPAQFLSLTQADIAADLDKTFQLCIANGSMMFVEMYGHDEAGSGAYVVLSFGNASDPDCERQEYICYPGQNIFRLPDVYEEWSNPVNPVAGGATIYNISIPNDQASRIKRIIIQPIVIVSNVGEVNLTEGVTTWEQNFTAGGPISLLFWGGMMNFADLYIAVDEGESDELILKDTNYETDMNLPTIQVAQTFEGYETLQFDMDLDGRAGKNHTLTVRGEGAFSFIILNTLSDSDADGVDDVTEYLLCETTSRADIWKPNIYGTRTEEESGLSDLELYGSNVEEWLKGQIDFTIPKEYAEMEYPLNVYVVVTSGIFQNFTFNGVPVEPTNLTLVGYRSDSTEEVTQKIGTDSWEKVRLCDTLIQQTHFIDTVLPGEYIVGYSFLNDPLLPAEISVFVSDIPVSIIDFESIENGLWDTDEDGLPDSAPDPSPNSKMNYEANSLLQLILPVSSNQSADIQVGFMVGRPADEYDYSNETLQWQVDEENPITVAIRPVMTLYGPGDSMQDHEGWWETISGQSKDYWDTLAEMVEFLGDDEPLTVNTYSLVTKDSTGTNHYDYTTGAMTFAGDADPLPLLGRDLAYGYYDLVFATAAEDTWAFGPLEYSYDHPALNDGYLDLRIRFQWAVIEIDPETKANKGLLSLYPMEANLVIQSITGKQYARGSTNYIVGAPSSHTESEVLYHYCQRPDVAIRVNGQPAALGKDGMDDVLRNEIIGEGIGVRYLPSYFYDAENRSSWGVLEQATHDYHLSYYNVSTGFSDVPNGKFPAGWYYRYSCSAVARPVGATVSIVDHYGASGSLGRDYVLVVKDNNQVSPQLDDPTNNVRVETWADVADLTVGTISFDIARNPSMTGAFNFGLIHAEDSGLWPVAQLTFDGSWLYYGATALCLWAADNYFQRITIMFDRSTGKSNLTIDGTTIYNLPLQNTTAVTDFRIWTDFGGICEIAIDNLTITSPRASQYGLEANVNYFATTETTIDYLFKLNQSILFNQQTKQSFIMYPGNDYAHYTPADLISSGNSWTFSPDVYRVECAENYRAHGNVMRINGDDEISAIKTFSETSTKGTASVWFVPGSDTNAIFTLEGENNIPAAQVRLRNPQFALNSILEYANLTASGIEWVELCEVWEGEWFQIRFINFNTTAEKPTLDILVDGVMTGTAIDVPLLSPVLSIKTFNITKIRGDDPLYIDSVNLNEGSGLTFQEFHTGDCTQRYAWTAVHDVYNGKYTPEDAALEGAETLLFITKFTEMIHEREEIKVDWIPLQISLRRAAFGSNFEFTHSLNITYGFGDDLLLTEGLGGSEYEWVIGDIPDEAYYYHELTFETAAWVLNETIPATIQFMPSNGDILRHITDNRIREIDGWERIHKRHSTGLSEEALKILNQIEKGNEKILNSIREIIDLALWLDDDFDWGLDDQGNPITQWKDDPNRYERRPKFSRYFIQGYWKMDRNTGKWSYINEQYKFVHNLKTIHDNLNRYAYAMKGYIEFMKKDIGTYIDVMQNVEIDKSEWNKWITNPENPDGRNFLQNLQQRGIYATDISPPIHGKLTQADIDEMPEKLFFCLPDTFPGAPIAETYNKMMPVKVTKEFKIETTRRLVERKTMEDVILKVITSNNVGHLPSWQIALKLPDVVRLGEWNEYWTSVTKFYSPNDIAELKHRLDAGDRVLMKVYTGLMRKNDKKAIDASTGGVNTYESAIEAICMKDGNEIRMVATIQYPDVGRNVRYRYDCARDYGTMAIWDLSLALVELRRFISAAQLKMWNDGMKDIVNKKTKWDGGTHQYRDYYEWVGKPDSNPFHLLNEKVNALTTYVVHKYRTSAKIDARWTEPEGGSIFDQLTKALKRTQAKTTLFDTTTLSAPTKLSSLLDTQTLNSKAKQKTSSSAPKRKPTVYTKTGTYRQAPEQLPNRIAALDFEINDPQMKALIETLPTWYRDVCTLADTLYWFVSRKMIYAGRGPLKAGYYGLCGELDVKTKAILNYYMCKFGSSTISLGNYVGSDDYPMFSGEEAVFQNFLKDEGAELPFDNKEKINAVREVIGLTKARNFEHLIYLTFVEGGHDSLYLTESLMHQKHRLSFVMPWIEEDGIKTYLAYLAEIKNVHWDRTGMGMIIKEWNSGKTGDLDKDLRHIKNWIGNYFQESPVIKNHPLTKTWKHVLHGSYVDSAVWGNYFHTAEGQELVNLLSLKGLTVTKTIPPTADQLKQLVPERLDDLKIAGVLRQGIEIEQRVVCGKQCYVMVDEKGQIANPLYYVIPLKEALTLDQIQGRFASDINKKALITHITEGTNSGEIHIGGPSDNKRDIGKKAIQTAGTINDNLDQRGNKGTYNNELGQRVPSNQYGVLQETNKISAVALGAKQMQFLQSETVSDDLQAFDNEENVREIDATQLHNLAPQNMLSQLHEAVNREDIVKMRTIVSAMVDDLMSDYDSPYYLLSSKGETDPEVIQEVVENYLRYRWGIYDEGFTTIFVMALTAQQFLDNYKTGDQVSNTLRGANFFFFSTQQLIKFSQVIEQRFLYVNPGLGAVDILRYNPEKHAFWDSFGTPIIMSMACDLADMWDLGRSAVAEGMPLKQAIAYALIRFVPEWFIEAAIDYITFSTLNSWTCTGLLLTSSFASFFINFLIGLAAMWIWKLYLDWCNSRYDNSVSMLVADGTSTMDWTPAIVKHGGLQVGDSLYYATAWENNGTSIWWRQRVAAGGPDGASTAAWNTAQHYTLSRTLHGLSLEDIGYVPDRFNPGPSYYDPGEDFLHGHLMVKGSYADFIADPATWVTRCVEVNYNDGYRVLHGYVGGSFFWMPSNTSTWTNGTEASAGGWCGSNSGYTNSDANINVGRYWGDEIEDGFSYYEECDFDNDINEYADWDCFAHMLPLLEVTPELHLYVMNDLDNYVKKDTEFSSWRHDNPVSTEDYCLGDANSDGSIDSLIETPVRVLEASLSDFLIQCTPVEPKVTFDSLLTNFTQLTSKYKWGDAASSLAASLASAQATAVFPEEEFEGIVDRLVDFTDYNNPTLTARNFDALDWHTNSLTADAADKYYLLQTSSQAEWTDLLGGAQGSNLAAAGWRPARSPATTTTSTMYSSTFANTPISAFPRDWMWAGYNQPKVSMTGYTNPSIPVLNISNPGFSSQYTTVCREFGSLFQGQLTVSFTRLYEQPSGNCYSFDLGLAAGGETMADWTNVAMIMVPAGYDVHPYYNGQELTNVWLHPYAQNEVTFDFDYLANTVSFWGYTFQLQNSLPPTQFRVNLTGVDSTGTIPFRLNIKSMSLTSYSESDRYLAGYDLTQPAGQILVPKSWVFDASRAYKILNQYASALDNLPCLTNIHRINTWTGVPVVDAGTSFSNCLQFNYDGPSNPLVTYTLTAPLGWDLSAASETTPLKELVWVPFTVTVPVNAPAGVYYMTFEERLADGSVNDGNVTYRCIIPIRVRYSSNWSLDLQNLPDVLTPSTTYTWAHFANTGTVPRTVLITGDGVPTEWITADGFAPIKYWDFDGELSDWAYTGTGTASFQDMEHYTYIGGYDGDLGLVASNYVVGETQTLSTRTFQVYEPELNWAGAHNLSLGLEFASGVGWPSQPSDGTWGEAGATVAIATLGDYNAGTGAVIWQMEISMIPLDQPMLIQVPAAGPYVLYISSGRGNVQAIAYGSYPEEYVGWNVHFYGTGNYPAGWVPWNMFTYPKVATGNGTLILQAPTEEIVTASVNISATLAPGDRIHITYENMGASSITLGAWEEFPLTGSGVQEMVFTTDTFVSLNHLNVSAQVGEGQSLRIYRISLDRSLTRHAPLAEFAFSGENTDLASAGWVTSFGSGVSTLWASTPVTNAMYVDSRYPTFNYGEQSRYTLRVFSYTEEPVEYMPCYFEIPLVEEVAEANGYENFGSTQRYLSTWQNDDVWSDSFTGNRDAYGIYGCDEVDDWNLIAYMNRPEKDWGSYSNMVYRVFGDNISPSDTGDCGYTWDISESLDRYFFINCSETGQIYLDGTITTGKPRVVANIPKAGVTDGAMFFQSNTTETFAVSRLLDADGQNITLKAGDKVWVSFETTCASGATITLKNADSTLADLTWTIATAEDRHQGTILREFVVGTGGNFTTLTISGTLAPAQNFSLAFAGVYKYQPFGTQLEDCQIGGFYNQTLPNAAFVSRVPVQGGMLTFDGTTAGFSGAYVSSVGGCLSLAPAEAASVTTSTALPDLYCPAMTFARIRLNTTVSASVTVTFHLASGDLSKVIDPTPLFPAISRTWAVGSWMELSYSIATTSTEVLQGITISGNFATGEVFIVDYLIIETNVPARVIAEVQGRRDVLPFQNIASAGGSAMTYLLTTPTYGRLDFCVYSPGTNDTFAINLEGIGGKEIYLEIRDWMLWCSNISGPVPVVPIYGGWHSLSIAWDCDLDNYTVWYYNQSVFEGKFSSSCVLAIHYGTATTSCAYYVDGIYLSTETAISNYSAYVSPHQLAAGNQSLVETYKDGGCLYVTLSPGEEWTLYITPTTAGTYTGAHFAVYDTAINTLAGYIHEDIVVDVPPTATACNPFGYITGIDAGRQVSFTIHDEGIVYETKWWEYFTTPPVRWEIRETQQGLGVVNSSTWAASGDKAYYLTQGQPVGTYTYELWATDGYHDMTYLTSTTVTANNAPPTGFTACENYSYITYVNDGVNNVKYVYWNISEDLSVGSGAYYNITEQKIGNAEAVKQIVPFTGDQLPLVVTYNTLEQMPGVYEYRLYVNDSYDCVQVGTTINVTVMNFPSWSNTPDDYSFWTFNETKTIAWQLFDSSIKTDCGQWAVYRNGTPSTPVAYNSFTTTGQPVDITTANLKPGTYNYSLWATDGMTGWMWLNNVTVQANNSEPFSTHASGVAYVAYNETNNFARLTWNITDWGAVDTTTANKGWWKITFNDEVKADGAWGDDNPNLKNVTRTFQDQPVGSYTVKFWVRDGYLDPDTYPTGFKLCDTTWVTVTNGAVTWTTPPDVTHYDTQAGTTITWTLADWSVNAAGAIWQVRNGTSILGSHTWDTSVASGGQYTVSFPTGNREPGITYYDLWVTDGISAIAPVDQVKVTVQDDDPSGPVITITYTGNGYDNNPGYWAVAITDPSGISNISVYVDDVWVGAATGNYSVFQVNNYCYNDYNTHPNYVHHIDVYAIDNDNDRTNDRANSTATVTQRIDDDDVLSPSIQLQYCRFWWWPWVWYTEIGFYVVDDSGISGGVVSWSSGASSAFSEMSCTVNGNTYTYSFVVYWVNIGCSEITAYDNDQDRGSGDRRQGCLYGSGGGW